MTVLSPSRPRPRISSISYPWLSRLSGSSLDSTAVAVAIAGTGWSLHFHEAPDYEASLILLPEDDDRFSTFVISTREGRLYLGEVRDDALRSLGSFTTLGATITRLHHAMADQAGA